MTEDLKQAVRRGNARRDLEWLQKGEVFVPCYVANGSFGGLVDEFGLHSRPNYGTPQGRTHVAHVEHYSPRHDNGGHVQRSLFQLQAWDGRGEAPGLGLQSHWEQELDLWTASCRTRWEEAGSRFESLVFASWETPQLWVWELKQEVADESHGLRLSLDFGVGEAENANRKGEAKLLRELEVDIQSIAGGPLWRATVRADGRASQLMLYIEGGEVTLNASKLAITPGGHCSIRALFLDRHLDYEIAKSAESFLRRSDHWKKHAAAVEQHWESSGLLQLPDGTPEASWWPLYAYYLPAIFSPVPSHILVSHGLTANNWGHGFPQDQWFAMMPLARLGLHTLCETQIRCFNDDLESYQRYAKRMCKREGVFFPWAAPFENMDGFETNGPTNKDTYQFHNAAYVFAMVWESYRIHRDDRFLERHFDLLEGVVRFFASNTELPEESDGAIFRNDDVPLRSQDEATAEGALTVQPLCSVWGSCYTMEAWLEACRILGRGDADLQSKVREILETGYDFSELVRDDGTLRTSATDTRELGMQKHPIQLTPLTYLPMAKWMDSEPVRHSWQKRHQLCKLTRVPRSLGWTFAQMAFASARARDGAAVSQDLELVQRARYADSMWLQFYECSDRFGGTSKIAFYFVTMQIYTMTMLECVAQDCREAIEFFPALPKHWEGKDFAFRKLRLRDGLEADGSMENGKARIRIKATRDCEFPLIIRLAGSYVLRQEGCDERRLEGGEAASMQMKAGQAAEIVSC